MNKKILAAFMIGMALAAGTPAVSAATVEPVGQRTFLYMDTNEIQLTESVRAVNRKDGSLALIDKDGEQQLAMKNIDAEEGGVGFYVREVQVAAEKSKRFWEISATVGAHDKNCGFWLISEENGQWRFELTVEDLIAAGYTPSEWHKLISGNVDGRYVLTSFHEYMPEGARFESERQPVVDWQVEILWSKEARSFLIEPIYPQ